MPAIASHSTATTDVPWDAGAQEKKLKTPLSSSAGSGMYAWKEAGNPDTKSGYKFPHHMVGDGGTPGAANLGGCRNGLARLSSASIPSGDAAGVKAHLARHLKDGGGNPSAEDWRL
jgi:hypothetical protein